MTTPPLTQKIFQGKMAITTRIGQFTHVQSKVIEIVWPSLVSLFAIHF